MRGGGPGSLALSNDRKKGDLPKVGPLRRPRRRGRLPGCPRGRWLDERVPGRPAGEGPSSAGGALLRLLGRSRW